MENIRGFFSATRNATRFIIAGYINDLLLFLKSNRRYEFADRYKGLVLGSSTSLNSSWIGLSAGFMIFVYSLPKPILSVAYRFSSRNTKEPFCQFYDSIKGKKIIHHDLLNGIPFQDQSVPLIYTSHFLEHVSYQDALFIMKECRRVLVPGGKIRIIVPSLDTYVTRLEQAIQEYKLGNFDNLLKHVTVENNSAERFSPHRFMYNFPLLARLLQGAGLSNIKQYYDELSGVFIDCEPKPRGGLIVEAEKRSIVM